MERYIQELITQLGKDKVHTAPFERFAYGADWSPRTTDEIRPPDVVVCPTTTEDVVKIIMVAFEHRVPVTTGGGLTGMLGGAVPIYGGIFIDSTTMNRIIEIDVANQTVRVQAGATIQAVNNAIEKYGLWLPHQPESRLSCTVGASIACDNDSTFGLRYGKILHCLLSAQIVNGVGEVLELGHRKALFSSSGYKLMALLAGSEGTLGVITEATLKVEPLPEHRSVDMILFPKLSVAVQYLSELMRAGIMPETANIACRHRIRFYTHAYRAKYGTEPEFPVWAEALLGITFAGSREVVEWLRAQALNRIKEYGGMAVKEREIVESWWVSKHTLQFEPFKQKWPDSQREKKFGAADPTVPMGRLEDFYQLFLETAKNYGLEVLGMNAYLEHSNSIGLSLSCAVFVDYRNQDEVNRFRAYHRELTKRAIEFEGSMSSYMGDSNVKVENFEYEHGLSTKYMLEIKRLFDPKEILNPGKKFPVQTKFAST